MAAVEGRLRQGTLQGVIGFVSRLLPVSPAQRPFKRVEDILSDFGCKGELLAIQLALLEEVVDESPMIALLIAVAGNQTAHLSLVFDREVTNSPSCKTITRLSNLEWISFSCGVLLASWPSAKQPSIKIGRTTLTKRLQ